MDTRIARLVTQTMPSNPTTKFVTRDGTRGDCRSHTSASYDANDDQEENRNEAVDDPGKDRFINRPEKRDWRQSRLATFV